MPTTPSPTLLPEPESARWTPLRAGIQNVWEYDDRRFVFTRGRLLLRGQNEAGKTKALELLFPFLLDADLSPQRLDPFGSTARPMRWNLVNDLEPAEQLRVGYLWLELGRVHQGAAEYVILGAGLKARRSAPDVDAWFFLTAQRPDRDLHLVVEGRPLTRGALEEAVGAVGQVFERDAAGYRRAVNSRLFGLQDEQYEALVDTLLHLRRPQLSKTLEPSQLSSFLTDALPPLDARVIGPIAEGFERLDHHRAELENLAATLRKLQEFSRVYRDYARSVARERALTLTRAEGAFGRARAEERERVAERDGLEARAEEVRRELEEQERRTREAGARIDALERSDAFRAARDLDEAEQRARRAAEHARGVSVRAGKDAEDLRGAVERARLLEGEAAERAAAVDSAAAIAGAAAEEALLGGSHAAVAKAAARGDAREAEGALAAIRAARADAVARLKALHGELLARQAQQRAADERAREQADARDAARNALGEAERAAGEAWEAWASEVDRWWEGLVELGASLPPLEAGAPEAEPAEVGRRVEELAAPVRQALADAAARIRAEARALEARRAMAQADRDALARARHPLHPAPAWRAERPEERPGAPLYALCEFGPGAAGKEAALEAALEATGLLDAWVEPDGTLLDAAGEVFLRGVAAAPGRTLAAALLPVAAGGVGLERAREVLGRIGLAAAGEAGEGSCWVAEDGRFRIGPLEGRHRKDAAAYVGAAARERERVRRLAELDAALRELDVRLADGAAELGGLEARRGRLAAELAAFPRGAEVLARRAEAAARARLFEEARTRAEEAERRAVRAAGEASQAAARLDQAAAEGGVAAFARDPGRLEELSAAYFERTAALLEAIRARARAVAERDRAAAEAARVRERAEASGAEEAESGAVAAEAGARAEGLRAVAGVARKKVLEALGAARTERDQAAAARRQAEAEQVRIHERLGAARTAAEAAVGRTAAADEARKAAADGYRALGTAGVLSAAELGGVEAPGEWSYTAALEHARGIGPAEDEEAGAEEGTASRSGREKVEDRLMRRHNELALQLPPGVRMIPSRAAEVLSYQLVWNGHTRPMGEVVTEIERDVAARSGLLGEEETGLLERFLTGEAHDHLALRLRSAAALVERMNGALEPRTTAGGTQVKLQWVLQDANAHADVHEAVPLFFKGGALLTESNRRTLRAFLERRLAEAREVEDERSLQERLAAVLDYRRWHRFEVLHREPGQGWAKLTRKVHGAGSGGKKSVLLHLPLFAAVAAFYDAAAPNAPRLVGLDEAFAGIDRPTRASLMGLLAEFDLDFVMTSFEEWGCYPQLDGLSTYHLSREVGHRGVFAEWFLWDGRERTLVDAS